MSTSSQIDLDADTVRRDIAADLETGSSALAEFSRRYARTPEYKNAALAMTVSTPKIEDEATGARLRSQMTEILDGILADRAHEDPGCLGAI